MEGLNKFREAFKDFSNNYVIIGGTACNFTMRGTQVKARATRDIDMIIIVEQMTPEYGERLWQFILEGGYKPEKKKNTNGISPKYEMYRFVNGKPGYPEMIELLSRHHDILGEPKGLIIEPIPLDEDLSSLSAIIMDDDYYQFTIEHSKLTDGIRHANSAALIALKTRAYLNLVNDKLNGKHVNTKDIKKHRSDVLKSVIIMTEDNITAPTSIVECVTEFVSSIRKDWNNLAESLSASLNQNTEFVEALLQQLENLFVIKT